MNENHDEQDLKAACARICEHADLGVKLNIAQFVSQMHLSGTNAEAISAMLNDPSLDWGDLVGDPRGYTVADVERIVAEEHWHSPVDIDLAEPDTARDYYLVLRELIDATDTLEHGRVKLREVLERLLAEHPHAQDAALARSFSESHTRRLRALSFLYFASRSSALRLPSPNKTTPTPHGPHRHAGA